MKLQYINFKVSGMTIQGGILWSGWPDDVRTALEKLEPVYSVHFDSATRNFGMAYYSEEFSLEAVRQTIEELGRKKQMPYEMTVID